MFTKRIIPCLDVHAGRVVKGVNFVNLRDAGDPVEIAAAYDAAGADELVFLDITASSDARNTVVEMVRRVAEKVFIPFTVGGVLFAKLLNLFRPEGKKLNPMIGAAGISAFPMSGRVVNKMGLEEDNQNFLLMYSISVNVSGQIASVIAGGLILTLMA